MERIITIEVPAASFRAIEEPFERGDYPTSIGVNAEVKRVVDALKREGAIDAGDEIIVNLRPSDKLKPSDVARTGTVETIYREDANGKGGIDSTSIGFTIELVQDANN